MPEPDISGFGTSDFNQARYGSNSPAPNTTTVLGTNDLQKAVDSFGSTVTKLEKLYEKMSKDAKGGSSGFVRGGSSGNAGGAKISNQQTSDGSGFGKQVQNAFSFMRGTTGAASARMSSARRRSLGSITIPTVTVSAGRASPSSTT